MQAVRAPFATQSAQAVRQSGNRSTVAQPIRRPCASCHHRTPQPIRQHQTRRMCAACQPFDRGEHRTPRRIRRHRVPVYPASRGEHRTPRRIPPRPCASLSGKPQPFDPAPPVSGSTVRAGFRPISAASRGGSTCAACLSGNAATVRQSQAVAVRRVPRPVSGQCVPDSARRPFNRCPFALQSRQPFDPRPLKSRRKRPCKPSAAPPMSAPV